jgi:aspartate aminotransferase-like enzyme
MLRKTRLFTPGPTPLLPAAQQAMAFYDMHHRTADFKALLTRTLSDLKEFIGTQNDVLILASSGTGAMEASVSNLTSPGDKVIVLTAGKFGERWTGLAKAYGCAAEVLSAPYGETFKLDDVKAKISGAPVVYVQGTETSTGARHDVQGIAKLVRAENDCLLVVDAITGLGTTHFDVDGWGIDFIIGGSQKALMIPPGLAYCAVSEKAWQRMETAKNPRFYFDLRKERKSQTKGETAFTPATTLVAGMGAALTHIRQMGNGDLVAGRKALIDSAELSAELTRVAATALGLKLFAPTCPSSAVTAIVAPAGIDSSALVKDFRESFGAVVANGQGEMKGKLLRVAHLGYYDYLDVVACAAGLEQVLSRAGANIAFGSSIKAVQEAYVSKTATRELAGVTG